MRKMMVHAVAAAALISLLICTSCGKNAENVETAVETEEEAASEDSDPKEAEETKPEDTEETTEESTEEIAGEETNVRTMEFTDVYGRVHTLTVDETAAMNDYDASSFVSCGDKMTYTDTENYTFRLGLDVSYYQSGIDWESVKADGFEFVFIRIGYRGYGSEGKLVEDSSYQSHLEGARAAGLDVGVYFFSQAVSEEEAIEEAAFVLDILDGTGLELPVVYDTEFILDENGDRIEGARTSSLDGAVVTENAIAFCGAIEEAGYEAALYSIMLAESEVFDMTAMSEYTVWYADYNETPQTPYAFEFWQYTESGAADGVDGAVDLNIQLISVR